MTTTATRGLWAELPPFVRSTLGRGTPERVRYDSLVPLGGRRRFMVTHPDDLRHVLVTNAANYTKLPQLTGPAGRRRAGHGLLTASGAEHRRQRRMMQPLFRRQVVALFDATIRRCVERRLATWPAGGRVDLAAEMPALAKSVLLEALFGDEATDLADGGLWEAIDHRRAFTEHLYHGRLPLREHIPTPVVRRYRAALRHIDGTIHRAISRRRAEPRDDLVSQLIGAVYDDGTTMGDRAVRDEVLTLTSTGYETVGDGLAWTWHLLAANPRAEEALRAEVGALGDRSPGADDLDALPYTGMVVSEALRLYPPTWVFLRVALGDDRLPHGGPLAAGSTLFLCQYVLHRHPRLFPDPERFAPERFADRAPRFAYLPFGQGGHRCIGEHLARLESVLVLAMVARRHRLSLRDPAPPAPRAGVTLRPRDPMWARVDPAGP